MVLGCRAPFAVGGKGGWVWCSQPLAEAAGIHCAGPPGLGSFLAERRQPSGSCGASNTFSLLHQKTPPLALVGW
jgi:hypothetical protein